MTYDRIIIRGDLTSPFFHLYVYKNGERVDWVGVRFEDLAETAIALLQKYELTNIDLSGPRSYVTQFETEIKEAIVKNYSDFPAVTFKYV